MVRWSDVEREAPELMERARSLFGERVHHALATLRRDGSPRISGTEVILAEGDLWLGSMPGSMKARDLRRDPRFALHGASQDPPAWKADAKVAGRVEEVADAEVVARVIGGQAPPGGAHLFRTDLTEVVVTSLAESGDHLVIESWHAGRGLSVHHRA